ncbi:hypothetical protein ACET47_08720 [Pseudomonas aeruginosa]
MNVVENGRLVAVKNNPDHPTGKATCLKGRAAPEIAHSARRLTTPLKRTAPAGRKTPVSCRFRGKRRWIRWPGACPRSRRKAARKALPSA